MNKNFLLAVCLFLLLIPSIGRSSPIITNSVNLIPAPLEGNAINGAIIENININPITLSLIIGECQFEPENIEIDTIYLNLIVGGYSSEDFIVSTNSVNLIPAPLEGNAINGAIIENININSITLSLIIGQVEFESMNIEIDTIYLNLIVGSYGSSTWAEGAEWAEGSEWYNDDIMLIPKIEDPFLIIFRLRY